MAKPGTQLKGKRRRDVNLYQDQIWSQVLAAWRANRPRHLVMDLAIIIGIDGDPECYDKIRRARLDCRQEKEAWFARLAQMQPRAALKPATLDGNDLSAGRSNS